MSDFPVVDLSTDALPTTTRSVRERLHLTKPVPIEPIWECLEIAVLAPTSANVRNWSFIARRRSAFRPVVSRGQGGQP
jgi:nitroreductase